MRLSGVCKKAFPGLPIALGLILAAVHAAPPQGQEPASPVRDAQAIAILRQAVNAAGGATAIAAIQDFTETGTITYNWTNSPVQTGVTVEGKGTTDFRIDSVLPQGMWTWAVSGYSGVLIAPDGSRTASAPYNLLTAGSGTLPILRLNVILSDSTSSIRYVGKVGLDSGQQAQRVQINQPVDPMLAANAQAKIGSFDIYLDPTSFLIVRLTEPVFSSAALRTSYVHELDFSGYRTVGNLLVPFSITEKINGQETWSMDLISINFNSGLTDTEFNP